MELVSVILDLRLDQFKASMFLAGIGVLLLAVLLLIYLSFKAQKRYDTEVLPSIGLEDEEAVEVDLVNPGEDDSASAFVLDDEVSEGDKEAGDLLAELRVATMTEDDDPVEKKKKSSGLFKKKSKK